MQHIAEVLQEMFPHIDRLNKVNWVHVSFKTPIVFRIGDDQFIIRTMRNFKGNAICELEMDNDKFMRKLNELPEEVRQTIDQRLKMQAA